VDVRWLAARSYGRSLGIYLGIVVVRRKLPVAVCARRQEIAGVASGGRGDVAMSVAVIVHRRLRCYDVSKRF